MMPAARRPKPLDGNAGRLSLGPNRTTVRAISRPRRATRGRLTGDTDSLSVFGLPATVVAPEDYDLNWRVMELHREALTSYTPSQLLNVLIDVSPQLSRAVWDFVLYCDPGHEITAFKPGTETPDDRAQAVLDEFLGRLKDTYGSIKVLTARLFMGAFTGGAFVSELVLDEAGRVPIDLVIPDPMSFRFRRNRDLPGGWELGQWQGAQFVSFADRPTIRYIPIHPKPGKPYGRPPALPAIFPCLFLLGLMYDLRRVVAQQGYPRIDIEVDLEKLTALYQQASALGIDGSFDDLIDQTLDAVESAYATLRPDDAFVHTNDSKVNRPVGALDSKAMSDADSLIKALERQAVQAAKSIPLLLGMTDGMSEANANRSYESFVAAIKSVQHLCEALLGNLFSLALESQGVAADVVVTFAELRAAEVLRDKQSEQLAATNAGLYEDAGYMTFVEAATYALGRPPSDEATKAHQEDKKKAEEIAATVPTTEEPITPNEGDVQESEPNGDSSGDRGNPEWMETAIRLATQGRKER